MNNDRLKVGFASDNTAPVHQKVIEAMFVANNGFAKSYGDDAYTKQMIQLFENIFSSQARVFLVGTGTGANSVALASITLPHQAVLCATSAHINQDECGAPEASGIKLIPLPTHQGKIT